MKEKTSQEQAAAERQVELITQALGNSLQHGGVWLNANGKTAPHFYPRGSTVSAFNSLTLALHSDEKGYKTNSYTLFSEAKKRGESVQGHEKGVPFNWYNWNQYAKRDKPDEVISKEEYQLLGEEQKSAYKVVRTREIRTLFNIDQTTLPFVDKDAYEKEVKEHGKQEERQQEDKEKGLDAVLFDFKKAINENLVPVRLDTGGTAHYDAKHDVVLMPQEKSYQQKEDYAADLVRQVVSATGHPQRLAREGVDGVKGRFGEDAIKQERLITELATGAKLMEMGLPARLSPESQHLVDHWAQEMKANPCLIDIIEKDVNHALEMVHKAERGEKVELKPMPKNLEGKALSEKPKHYFVADEIKGLPNKDTKEFVVVLDKEAKMADVVMPTEAALSAGDDLPGLNKLHIEKALQKQGYDTVTFYNVDGSMGFRPDDGYFKDKEVDVVKMKRYQLEEVARLDVTDAVNRADSVLFDKVLMLRSDEGKWALFLKPQNEASFCVIPSKEDTNRFFTTIRLGQEETTDQMRTELAQKYYTLAKDKPELKENLFKSNATEAELKQIERVIIFKTKAQEEKPSAIYCMPTVNGEKMKPREVTPQQWQRMWLAEDKQDYKMHLAASLFADVLRQGRSDAVGVGTDKNEQEAQTETKEVQHAQFHEDNEKKEEQKEEAPVQEESEKLKEAQKAKEAINRDLATAIHALPLIIEKFGQNNQIRVRPGMGWNSEIQGFRLDTQDKRKVHVDVYWQGDSTDGNELVALKDIYDKVSKGKEYVIPAQTSFDGKRTREVHSDIRIDKDDLTKAIKEVNKTLDKVIDEEAKKQNSSVQSIQKEEEAKKNGKKPELSPILKQFVDLKKKHPDALLLFRCGDFYETYMKDAENASRILGITLTKSSKMQDTDGKPLAMAGFPFHALDTYLPKLIRAGQRVAICDQIEAPRQTAKRGITENLSPGASEGNGQKVDSPKEQPKGIGR